MLRRKISHEVMNKRKFVNAWAEQKKLFMKQCDNLSILEHLREILIADNETKLENFVRKYF